MNRDRPSTQVMDPVSSSSSSSSRQGQEASAAAAGLSKIEAMALLLKQKVAGPSAKQQRVPNKINHPWALSTSSRSSSFPSPTASTPTTPTGSSSSLSSNGSPFYKNKNVSSSATSSSTGASGHKKESSIKAMIAAREDPSLSCNKMAPPTTQPGPAPQRREAPHDAPGPGMTKVQLGSGRGSQPPTGATTARTTAQEDQGENPTSPPSSSSPSLSSPTSPSTSTPIKEQYPPSPRERKEDRSTLTTDPLSTPQQLMTVGAFESGEDEINLVGDMKPGSGSDSIDDGPHGVLGSTTPTESITAAPTTAPSAPSTTSTATTPSTASRRRNAGGALVPSQFAASEPPALTFSTSSSLLVACVTKTIDDEGSVQTTDKDADVAIQIKTETAVPSSSTSTPPPTSSLSPIADPSKMPTETAVASSPSSSKAPSPPSTSSSSSTTTPMPSTPDTMTPLLKRPSRTVRRHTTASSSSSSLLSGGSHSYPFASQVSSPPQQPMSIINPTLRQLQTPQIPLNLVQARILQQEEQKRRDEELAKIPITANLRTVKKIQPVLISSDDEDDDKDTAADKRKRREEASAAAMSESTISEGSDLLSPEGLSSRSSSSSTGSRPRSKTATATSASSVLVSTLHGYHKQRGDRNHVEPVAIPKRLADQVEHILGRKLAGKGSVLDEREKEREEEEARKAAEPLPPIVLGKARKRAVTSAHIQSLVSSWDHKVEEAKETTSEAERIRQFLEARSTAHAEMPKPKTPLTASELLAPLPPLPPPPPMTEQSLGETMRRKGGRHVKGASSASVSSLSSSSSRFGSTSGYSILSASALTSSSKPPSSTKSPSSPTGTDTSAAKSTLVKQPSRSRTKPSIQIEGQEGDLATGESCLGSGQDSPLREQQQERGQKEAVASRTKLSTSTKSKEEETKRSGALLVNKAATSRPRRTGVRVPTSSSSSALANVEELKGTDMQETE